MTPSSLLSPSETDAEASRIESGTSPERGGRNTEKADAFRSSRRIRDVLESVARSLRSLCTFSQSQKGRQRPRHLGGVEGLEPRLYMSGVPAEVRYVDANGAYTLRTETVAEQTIIDFSTLEQGVHAQEWTTNVPGLGNVTMWFQGGAKVDSHGVSAVTQPDWGTSWFIRFNDRPVTIKSAELDFMGTSPQGQLGMQVDGDYLRENNRIVYLPLQTSVNIGGRTMSVLDASQRSGKVAVKSVTLETSVTREVKDYVDDEMEGVIELLAAARQTEPETVTETVTEVKTIDFRSLEQGVHGEQWTTNVPGLGNITAWFQGGTKIDSHGMSAVTQPDSGTGFWIRFDDGPVKVLSAELDFMGTNPEGRLGMQVNGDYLRENDRIVYLPLQTSVDVGGRTMSVFDEAQRYGKVAVKSMTVETSVTRAVPKQEDPAGKEMVLAPVSALLERIGNDGVLGLRISTPLDETYLKTTNYGVIRTEHTGGADNLMIFNNYLADMMENERGSATKVWTIYGDKDLKIPLAELTFVGNRSAVSLVSALPLPVRRNMLPDGVEYERAPEMHVAHVEGPNAIFEVSSPLGESTIEFVGVHDDSILGRARVTKGAAGVRQTATITMNPANATGDYHALMTGADGRVFGRVLLHWDREAKQLSLPAGTAAWTAPEEFVPTLEAAKTSLHENLVSMSTTDPALGVMQREILLSAASSMPGIGCDFDEKFFAAHPEWSVASRESATQSELRTFSETYQILRSDFGTFQSMLGDFLRQGTAILTQIRNGGNETALRDEFARAVSVAGTSLPMYRLASIGITMPAGGIILEAAKGAGERVIGQLADIKEVERLKILAEQERSNSPSYAGSAAATPPPSDIQAQRVMNRIRAAQAGLPMYGADGTTEVGRGGVLFTDAGDTRLVSVTTNPTVLRHAAIEAILRSSNQTYQYGMVLPAGREATTEKIPLKPKGNAVITFTLKERMMVNLSSTAVGLGDIQNTVIGKPNIGLTLYGKDMQEIVTSQSSDVAGKSISRMLEAGTYYLNVEDVTSYAGISSHDMQTVKLPEIPVLVELNPYHSNNIVGKISIEGSDKVMPVSMRVAEFYTDENNQVKRKTDYNLDPNNGGVSKLKTDKPVWVVVHGRNDRDDSSKMIELEKALTASGYQVVTIDWRDAAKSFLGVQGEAWIQAVGDWAFRALKDAGVKGENIHIGSHSWGTFVGYEIAEHFKKVNGFGVDTFIALDSAIDPSSEVHYKASQINFSAVSKSSTALWSSAWGSEGRASTAQRTIEIRTENEAAVSPWIIANETLKHGMAVTTFANIVRLKKIDPLNQIAEKFSLSSNEVSNLPSREGVDAWMYVAAYHENGNGTDDDYIDGVPASLTFTNPDDVVQDLYFYSDRRNLQ